MVLVLLVTKLYSQQCLFYGLDNDLWTGLVFYEHDLSEDGMMFYRPVVDRLDM